MPRRFVRGKQLCYYGSEFGSAGDVYGGTGCVTHQVSTGKIQNALILFEVVFANKAVIYFFRVSNSQRPRVPLKYLSLI